MDSSSPRPCNHFQGAKNRVGGWNNNERGTNLPIATKGASRAGTNRENCARTVRELSKKFKSRGMCCSGGAESGAVQHLVRSYRGAVLPGRTDERSEVSLRVGCADKSLTQRGQDAKKDVPLLVAQGKEFPINSLLPFSSQGRRRGRGMRWVNTRSLCFANRMDFEKYPPDLARDCIAAGSFKRCSVLFPPSSPPPLAPALREKGCQAEGILGIRH